MGTDAPAEDAVAARARVLRAARLDASFFQRDALAVARALIGTFLVHEGPSHDGAPGLRVGRIVETEAYRGPTDGACHARFGLTRRTRTLFGPPGHAYVFLIYGMHDCFNVVCHAEGKGHAVLVRAVEPLVLPPPRGGDDGAAAALRGDGPGRVTRVLALSRQHDGASLTDGGPVFLAPRGLLGGSRRPRIAVSARVNVAYAGAIAEAPWRFFDEASHHVSRPGVAAVGLGRGAPAFRPGPRPSRSP